MDERELISLKNRYDIVGNDPALNYALEIAVRVAPADDLTVLVSGESGVGKDVMPRLIHQNSPRKGGKYLAVNCGAIAEGTVDSELFGHEKGAFTGAVEMRKGYFEEADGGTLFLDEVSELPLASQAKLLRVLQSGEFIRVGSSKVLKTNVRVIVATNRNLMHQVSVGKFREDLYYRISSVHIDIPSLRDRREDIPLLFRKFSLDFTNRYFRNGIQLTPDAVELIKKYRWPGNIRQLKSVAESMSMLETVQVTPGQGRVLIDALTVARYLPKEDENTLPALTRNQGRTGMNDDEREMFIKMMLTLKQKVEALESVVFGNGNTSAMPFQPAIPQHMDPSSIGVDVSREDPDEQGEAIASPTAQDTTKTMGEIKKEQVLAALRKYGSKKAAAEALGISERTIYRTIKQLGIK